MSKKWPRLPPPNLQKLPETSAWSSKVNGDILLGKVKAITNIGLQRITCLKVKVPQNNFFEYSRMFYMTNYEQWALDPESKCKVGDVILIKRARENERPSSHVHYKLEKIVFEYGNLIDPITQRRVFNGKEFEREVELRRGIVSDVFDEPLGDEPVSHERKRQHRKQQLESRREQLQQRRSSSDEMD